MCSSGVPAVSASTIAPQALPAAVPVLVNATPRPPRHARVGIGHVRRARFTARGNAANDAAPHDRVENRHVVNADHAEGGAHAGGFEKCGDDVAGDHAFRHSG